MESINYSSGTMKKKSHWISSDL